MKKEKEQSKRSDISEKELRSKIEAKLAARGILSGVEADDEQLYHAVTLAIKDIMISKRERFIKKARAENSKKICYLCMEFLVGRSLKNISHNLGIYKSLCNILLDFGSDFERIYSFEVDPGLGNGGLGRLAACFMDSLSALNYLANGYSLLYETGLFRQRIVDGEQVELAETWLENDGDFLVVHPENSFTVRLGGRINESWDGEKLNIIHTDYDEVKAVPYDLLIPGAESAAVNKIRLWRARGAMADNTVRDGLYRSVSAHSNPEVITRQLYPKDDYDEGKLLRLTQQYFLVSASLQSIISDYYAEHGSLDGFADNVAIHINDTHPALCIPELMRILMDVYSYSWDDAWSVVVRCVSYTNHTVLPEALECWRVDLFSMKLPRIYSIISEINKKFTADLWNLYPGDWDRISRMSIVAYNQVRMANLSVVGSHSVNGVSKLHSEILKKTVFHDFYKMTPWKLTNVTNGVAHRRWLTSSNEPLADLIESLIGDEYKRNANCLSSLLKYTDDPLVLSELEKIKQKNKTAFANHIYEKCSKKIDETSFFDVQIKRMHEYKRQLLNVLKILAIYNELHDSKNATILPQTFIFGSKAAPGYDMAKKLIKLINFLSEEIEKDPRAREVIRILFVEDYNVSLAEKLIPAADLSEQISLAGKEASGTGCMKLMMNGALTIGTLDGANVEICEAVGRENIYIFGLNSGEVDEISRGGYIPRNYYYSSKTLRDAVDRLASPICGADFSFIIDYLLGTGQGSGDPFMCLADFDSYYNIYKKAVSDFADRETWNKRSLINIGKSGIFSSDNSIKKYAEEIWHAKAVYRS